MGASSSSWQYAEAVISRLHAPIRYPVHLQTDHGLAVPREPLGLGLVVEICQIVNVRLHAPLREQVEQAGAVVRRREGVYGS